MAKRNYLVEGLSGAGKSSVYEELIRRGYKAISTDRAWAYHADPDTGLRGGFRLWDPQKAIDELESAEPEVLFVCGSSRNRDRFLPYFTKVFNLRIDDEIVELKEWDAVRVPPGTWRGYEAGPEGLEILVIGAPNLGEAPREDVDGQRDWWAD